MKTGFSKVSVIGLGYIGLPTAAVLASYGLEVVGVDTNPAVVDAINACKVNIVEPDFDSVVNMAVINKKLRAATQTEGADAFIIAVPTPIREDKSPDLSFVKAAARSIAAVLKKGDLVILESTSPVGTTEELSGWLAELRPDLSFPRNAGETVDVNVAYCPERVLPGNILRELVGNDRIIGGLTSVCAQRAKELYRIFVKGECRLTNARTAEMAKLTENAYRDVNIAFANELSVICDGLGIDVWELISLANQHPRVNVLLPSTGVGGHCIAVDPWFIVHSAPDVARLIRMARQVNDEKPGHIASKIRDSATGIPSPVISCLGLAYKANINDLRGSPAVKVVEDLARSRPAWQILCVEPYISELPGDLSRFQNVSLVGLEEAARRGDVMALLVGHRAFPEMGAGNLFGKRVVDACGLWK